MYRATMEVAERIRHEMIQSSVFATRLLEGGLLALEACNAALGLVEATASTPVTAKSSS